MQTDFHGTATLCVAKEAGLSDDEAKIVAWANVQTDKCKRFGFHTQVNWLNFVRSKAGTYFHFLPGDDRDQPRMTTENCEIARQLVAAARTPIEKGIAIHTMQDTFSHQNFEPHCTSRNNTQPWAQWWPHYGHSSEINSPDILSASWYDGRTERTFINRGRFANAMRVTYQAVWNMDVAATISGTEIAAWAHTSDAMRILYDECLDYEPRKAAWATAAGMPGWRFSDVQKEMWAKYGPEFKRAAKRQARIVKEWLKNQK